ncbi:hypothetical protein BDZ45DRAFT_675979 [Acephala macrosclerotiorum]|nr:hypothetical protein BDZ45DRAFT_675979 [Acephala macrosclerotiorum]
MGTLSAAGTFAIVQASNQVPIRDPTPNHRCYICRAEDRLRTYTGSPPFRTLRHYRTEYCQEGTQPKYDTTPEKWG